MRQNDDNRWLNPLLEQHIGREPGEFDFAAWTRDHPDEARLLHRGYEHTGRNTKTRTLVVWRILMESKVTRYSAVAVVLLALTLVILNPFGGSGNGGVVLADVKKTVAAIETMILRGTNTFPYTGVPTSVSDFYGKTCKYDLTH